MDDDIDIRNPVAIRYPGQQRTKLETDHHGVRKPLDQHRLGSRRTFGVVIEFRPGVLRRGEFEMIVEPIDLEAIRRSQQFFGLDLRGRAQWPLQNRMQPIDIDVLVAFNRHRRRPDNVAGNHDTRRADDRACPSLDPCKIPCPGESRQSNATG